MNKSSLKWSPSIPHNKNGNDDLLKYGGTFSNAAPLERLATIDGRGSFLVNYGLDSSFDPNEIVLTDFLLAGDYNVDGTVDAADFTVWRDTDGSPEGYAAWQANFGLSYGIGSSSTESATVPEPSICGLLLALALVAGLGTRCHR